MDIPGLKEYAKSVGMDPASAARNIIVTFLDQWSQSPNDCLMMMTGTATVEEAVYAVDDSTVGGIESVECDDHFSQEVVDAAVTIGKWCNHNVVYRWVKGQGYDVMAIENDREMAVKQWRETVLDYTRQYTMEARTGMWAVCNWNTHSPDLHWSGPWMDHHAIAE